MTPNDILQTYLDTMGASVLQDDWTTYRRGVALPFHLVTEDASIVVADEDKLRMGFDSFVQTLNLHGITDYIRLAESITQIDDEMISGSYVTHMLKDGKRVVPPFKSQITLRRVDGVWQGASISNSLKNARWPVLMPNPADDPTEEGR